MSSFTGLHWISHLWQDAPGNASAAPPKRTQLVLQLENPTYRSGDVVRLATSFSFTTASDSSLKSHFLQHSLSSYSSSSSSTVREIVWASPFPWKHVHSLRVSVHGRLHLLRPAAALFPPSPSLTSPTSPTTSNTRHRVLYDSAAQIIPIRSESGVALAADTTAVASFLLPLDLPPTFRGHYVVVRYSVHVHFLNAKEKDVTAPLRIPLLLRGSTTALATDRNHLATNSMHMIPFVLHRMFDNSCLTTKTQQDDRQHPHQHPHPHPHQDRSISISHLRVCSHEDEVVESGDSAHQIPHNNHQRLNETTTLSAKTTQGEEVFITLHNSKPRASESITFRFNFINTICSFACVGLVQHEILHVTQQQDATTDVSTTATATTPSERTHVSTLASWHETTTHTMSSWCSLTIPENALTFEIVEKSTARRSRAAHDSEKNIDAEQEREDVEQKGKGKASPMLEVRHILRFQFHLKGAETPMSCEIPIFLNSEWRCPITPPITELFNVENGGRGSTRWCVLR